MTPPPLTEATPLDELLWRLADGDREAFAPAFAALWPRVLRFTKRWLTDPGDAEDAAQQALEKLFFRASELDRSRPPLAWVFTVATWECRTFRRRSQRSREVSGGLDEAVAGEAPSPEENLDERRLAEALEVALREVSEVDRATLLAAIRDELPSGVARATFRKRKERALDRLRVVWRTLNGSI